MTEWQVTTVESLYNDTPEIRTPLLSGLCVGPSYIYDTIPEMWTPH